MCEQRDRLGPRGSTAAEGPGWVTGRHRPTKALQDTPQTSVPPRKCGFTSYPTGPEGTREKRNRWACRGTEPSHPADSHLAGVSEEDEGFSHQIEEGRLREWGPNCAHPRSPSSCRNLHVAPKGQALWVPWPPLYLCPAGLLAQQTIPPALM